MSGQCHSTGGGGDSPSVLVVGAGAVGGYFGAMLARAGAGVSVVARSEYDVLSERGIRIEGPEGDFIFQPERVVRSPAECESPFRVVLVATKVVPEVDVPGIIRPVVASGTVILLIQNGIHIEAPVAEAFPENELLSGLAFMGIERRAPCVLRRRDNGRLVLGKYPSGDSAAARDLCALFGAAGVPCEVSEAIEGARWRKLVWNAAFNPVSVLGGGIDTHAILDDPASRALIVNVMTEVMQIAQAYGHELPGSLLEYNLDVTRSSSSYRTSMTRDLEEGRSMEVEAILGNAVRAARGIGLDVPHMESLHALLRLLDRDRTRRRCEGGV